MTHIYNIKGMTCDSCLARAKDQLLKIGDITKVNVQLESPQATIDMERHVPVATLQSALDKAGGYIIDEADGGMHHAMPAQGSQSWIKTYKPILLVFAYITGITILIETTTGMFVWDNWMQNFMAAFFLLFSFFKMLDLKGFAEGYFSYDIIAKRWMGWGYVYPFIELALGLAYLVRFDQLITNIATIVLMGISSIGVINSLVNKRKIQCACLGTVFNLPLSTVTIIEDGLMIAMSAIMLTGIV